MRTLGHLNQEGARQQVHPMISALVLMVSQDQTRRREAKRVRLLRLRLRHDIPVFEILNSVFGAYLYWVD